MKTSNYPLSRCCRSTDSLFGESSESGRAFSDTSSTSTMGDEPTEDSPSSPRWETSDDGDGEEDFQENSGRSEEDPEIYEDEDLYRHLGFHEEQGEEHDNEHDEEQTDWQSSEQDEEQDEEQAREYDSQQYEEHDDGEQDNQQDDLYLDQINSEHEVDTAQCTAALANLKRKRTEAIGDIELQIKRIKLKREYKLEYLRIEHVHDMEEMDLRHELSIQRGE